jgi:uncharacterized protein (DUF433 family)
MSEPDIVERIHKDLRVMLGKPVVRGTRITVEHVRNLLANGSMPAEITDEYPGLTVADVRACVSYARSAIVREAAAFGASWRCL